MMGSRNVLEFGVWLGVVATHAIARATMRALEWLFVAVTWIALLVIGAVMACRRGGLPGSDLSDARATSRSPDR